MEAETLKLKLKKFGLNPTDWRMILMDSRTWLIVNRLDWTYRLMGRTSVRNSQINWNDISLVSI